MNRERHRYWSAYIADLQGRMLLADWWIELSRKPLMIENAKAAVQAMGPKREAMIWLAADFDESSRSWQRHYIVHELVHCHFHPLFTQFEAQCCADKGIARTLQIAHRSHEEYAVDDLARIIAPHMPLPPKAAKP